jgi:hypothetical protein
MKDCRVNASRARGARRVEGQIGRLRRLSAAIAAGIENRGGRRRKGPTRQRTMNASMEMNKNQFLTIGLLVLFFGLQFRWVDGFTLKAETKAAIQERMNKNRPLAAQSYLSPTMHPPEWLGWSLLTSGIVITAAALALKSK